MVKRNRPDWDKHRETIFEMASNGKSFRFIAQKLGINYRTLSNWFHRSSTVIYYEKYCKENRCEPKKKNRRIKEDEVQEVMPKPQNFCDKFKQSIKIGERVKNYMYNESGIVTAKFPSVFTVRTDFGYLTSYTYSSFREFTRNEKKP